MSVLYGLIGYPLTHSFSPAYFARKFEAEKIEAIYEKFELRTIYGFPALLETHKDLKGLNVTIPYKQEIIPYLHALDDAAKKIGAVNCIDIKDGRLKGYNTDVIGFEKSLLPLLKPLHKKALVLGTGGSALAVKYVLSKLGISFLSVSREQKKHAITYEALNNATIREHLLIINTTPLGMFPDLDGCPDLPYNSLTRDHLLYDLIYNPRETKFLAHGRKQGAATKNGLEMLHLQAAVSWDIWTSN